MTPSGLTMNGSETAGTHHERARRAFALGYSWCQSGAARAEDAPLVEALRAEFSLEVGTYVAETSEVEGVVASPVILGPHGKRWGIDDEQLTPFAQGALSALCFLSDDGEPCVELTKKVEAPLKPLLEKLGFEALLSGKVRGVPAFDLVGRIARRAPLVLPSLGAFLHDWSLRVLGLSERGTPKCVVSVQRTRPDAFLPQKEHLSDSGYDLTLLYEKKRFGETILFGTGIIIEPPYGWYFDVVPRSSIIKRGYILANSVGVIDRSYRGEIFVPLIKIDRNAPDLELPARVAQLIPRPIVHFPIEEKLQLSDTIRGAGGFGSTGT